MSKKIVILGSGIAGLGAGWKLSKEGYEVKVIEKESRIGGLAGSIHRDGYTFDFGPHAFHSQNPRLLSTFFHIMNGEKVVKQKKYVQIKFRGKFYDYPLKPANVFLQLKPQVAAKCARDLLWSKIKNSINTSIDDSTESWLVNRFGKSIYDIYFGPYTQKVWGVLPSELSSKFISGRVPSIKIRDLLLQQLLNCKNSTPDNPHEVPMDLDIYYPAKGAIVFSEMMLKEILFHGGKLFTNSHPNKLEVGKNKIEGVVFKKNKNEMYFKCDYLISTIPITELSKLMNLKVEGLKYRAIIIVCLMVNKQSVFNPQTIYFTECIFNRIAQMNNYSIDTVPAGKSGITAEIMCNAEDDIWKESEHSVCEMVISNLVKEKVIDRKDIEGYFVLKNKYGYPILLKGYESNLELIFDELRKKENLLTGGRQGLFNYIQMDFALNSGFKMAEYVIYNNSKSDLEEKALNLSYYR